MGFFGKLFGGNHEKVSKMDELLINQLADIETALKNNDGNFHSSYNEELRNLLKMHCTRSESGLACLNLALLYLYGINVQEDAKLAEELLLKAVSIGNEAGLAYKYLALIENEIKGNLEQSFTYMKKGSDMGDVCAMTDLGLYYMTGKGVAEDRSKAISLWEKAARLGSKTAKDNLGRI